MNFPELDPAKRHDIYLFISAHLSNPNGDMDNDNAPRTDPVTGHGIISAVSIKRKARDYVQERYGNEAGMGIFIQAGESMTTKAVRALQQAGVQAMPSTSMTDEELGELLVTELPAELSLEDGTLTYEGGMKPATRKKYLAELEKLGVNKDLVTRVAALLEQTSEKLSARDQQQKAFPVMVSGFWDNRLFGYTAPGSSGKSRGPVQLTDAESLAPVTLLDQSGTRIMRAKDDDKEGSNIWRKTVVNHALYMAAARLSVPLAQQSGVTGRDLQVLLEGLYYGQAVARSSSRPDVQVEGLIVFSHDSAYGSAPDWKLQQMIDVQHDEHYKNVELSIKGELPQGIQVQILR